MDNVSIISIPDSDSSVMNETYSPRNRTAQLPVTPKRELEATLNTTFTPEDNKPSSGGVQNETFSPVKEVEEEEQPPPPVLPLKSALKSPAAKRNSRTPIKRKLPEVPPAEGDGAQFESPVSVPQIVVVPPSTERKSLRRSGRTPAKVEYAPPTTRRRSTRQTPLKTVNEEKKEPLATDKVNVVDVEMVHVAEPDPPTSPPKSPEPVIVIESVAAQKEEEEEKEKPVEETSDEIFRAPPSPARLLKSIRKRSLSVTDVDPMPKRNFRVQFHSPGNMEKTITEIDESLYLNFSKTLASSFSVNDSTTSQSMVGGAGNKPGRRKRSLSNAETPVDKLATLQMLHAKEKKLPTPSPRKKMPNFAAIHQSIFQQMESLVDFSERKKERAQFLLKPTTPTKTVTAPGPSFAKPVSRGAIGKASAITAAKKSSSSNLMKPKGRTIGKKPVTGPKVITDKKWQAIMQNTDFPAILGQQVGEQEVEKESIVQEKEKNEDAEEVKIQAHEENVESVVEEAKENKQTVAKESGIKQPRSYGQTAVKGKLKTPLKTSSLVAVVKKNVVAVKNVPVAKVLPTIGAVKVATDSVNVSKAALNTSSYTMVKGVRMNRRFELMMKHRNTKGTGKK